MQQQRAQDQAMFDRLKGVMGSAADSLPGATKLKGYAQVLSSLLPLVLLLGFAALLPLRTDALPNPPFFELFVGGH